MTLWLSPINRMSFFLNNDFCLSHDLSFSSFYLLLLKRKKPHFSKELNLKIVLNYRNNSIDGSFSSL